MIPHGRITAIAAVLLAAANGALAAMQQDGSINQLEEKWGLP